MAGSVMDWTKYAWKIDLTITQMRKVEKVFRSAGFPYFTEGDGAYSTYDGSNIPQKDGKFVVHAWKLWIHAEAYGLVQALKTEFSNVDIVEWMKQNAYK